MKWAEPAVIDMFGASWASTHSYSLVDSAKRYEQYERSMASQVGCFVRLLKVASLLHAATKMLMMRTSGRH